MTDLNALKQEVYDIVRAIYDVHNELGPGLVIYNYNKKRWCDIELSLGGFYKL